MATEYLTTDIDLKKVADGIRSRTGKTAPLAFPDGYVTEISTLTNTSDATAASSDIVRGKTAYVKGAKVTGNLSPYSLIDVGSEDQLAIPYRTQDSFMVEGLCSVSGNTIIDGNTRVRTYIAIPGDATPDSVLEGATFSSSEGIEVTGTMPDNGAADIQLSNLEIVDVAEGYYSGGTARIAAAEAAKIIPENIKKGVTIFGVPGKMEAGGETGTTSLTVYPRGGLERPILCSWQTESGWMYTNKFDTSATFTLTNVLIGGHVILSIDPQSAASFVANNETGVEFIYPVGLDSTVDTYDTSLVLKITSANPTINVGLIN